MINFARSTKKYMISTKSTSSLIILLFLSLNLFSQLNTDLSSSQDIFQKLEVNEKGVGEVVIFQDMRINELMYNSVENNKRKAGVPGYRIKIFNNLGNKARAQSQAAHTRFYELFPEIPIYPGYKSPYFIVYVGDYRTKIDAMKDFKQIKRYFRSAFIVPSKINYPDLED
ncbi:MAG: hypothetical protein GQ564_01575 [Bacteroidales bacterium]|nr:hypothetical protein [Bacteroidales bacterium]